MKATKENKKNATTKTTTKKTTAKTAGTTAKTAANINKNNKAKKDEKMEYVNIHGLKAFQYGEKITANDGRINITAINCAIQAVRIKRDHNTNTTIYNYLLSIDAGLSYAWQYMNANGQITNFNNINKEDIEDAIADAREILVSHTGEKYSQDIQKEARNAVGRKWQDSENAKENLLAISLDEQKENNGDALEDEIISQSIFDNGDDGMPHNKYLIKALDILSDEEKYIILRICARDTQENIASDMNKSQSYVSKKYKKAIASLQKILVLENGKVKLAK